MNSYRFVLISKHSRFDHLQVLGLLVLKQGYLVVEAPVAEVALVGAVNLVTSRVQLKVHQLKKMPSCNL